MYMTNVSQFDINRYLGKRYGRLVVIGLDHYDYNCVGKRRFYLKCRCDCGNEVAVIKSNLTSGNTKSCGCYYQDTHHKHNLTTHTTKHPLVVIMNAMRQRCYNPNNDNYHLYGGRGIKICDEWMDPDNGFLNFYNWSMDHGYEKRLTIDRIDSNGNYEPSNCRWVDDKVQNRNLRRNVFLTYTYKKRAKSKKKHYITLCKKDWSVICNVSEDTIAFRLKKYGGKNINQIIEECNEIGRGTRDIIIPDEILKYNDPTKYEISFHD